MQCANCLPEFAWKVQAVMQVTLQPSMLPSYFLDNFRATTAQPKASWFHNYSFRRVGMQAAGGVKYCLTCNCVAVHVRVYSLLLCCDAHLALILLFYLQAHTITMMRASCLITMIA